ncbi:unnamed protein product, partial [Nippostrongylus brasiliensis]|uniref:Basement membrane proteoglycan (inferred by orthology to a C. elegans protein) n=1 Tax=Nippostrongylus brasiliensis TaxID=27835 RepID=A0A158R261_NIPBR
LGHVGWEIAVDRPTSDGLALEVEQCSCPPGYIGTSCEDCAPGYERSGHGPYLGTCVPIQQRAPQCTGAGVSSPYPGHDGRCQCKTYAQGANCDQCPPHSFYMSQANPQGCIPCFCSGVTQQCQSSSFRRQLVEINYPRGDRDQLTLTTSDIRQPYRPPTPAYVSGRAIEFVNFNEAAGQVLYWKLPSKFLGNKVTAYGGTLRYTFRFSGQGRMNQDPDVIIRGNDISLQYTHREPVRPDSENTIELKFFEDKWQRVDGQQGTREHLLMALADLDDILIKATYMEECSQSSLITVSLEFAEPQGTGLTAYEATLEHLAKTALLVTRGLAEYGFCVDCQHNTEGDQCERCKPGFIGDARRGTPHDCQPAATRPPCHCNNHSPRGCDSFGRCLLCEHSTEGTHCERCKKGFYGDATKGTPYDCTPCPCPGAADCYLDSQGQVACRNCPAGLSGRLSLRVRILERKHQVVAKGANAQWICQIIGPMRSLVRLEWTRVGYPALPQNADVNIYDDAVLTINDVSDDEAGQYRCTATTINSIATDDATLTINVASMHGRPPQPVVDPPHLTVNEGEPAAFRCWVPGLSDCQMTWHKERIGGALPHGVYQTGNALKIPRAQLHDAGNYICTAVNDYGIGQSPPARLDVIRPVQRPKVDPIEQTVEEGEPARFRCWVPGNPNVELKWHRAGHQPLPSTVQEQQGILHIPRASQQEVGQYVCTATDPRDPKPQDSDPVTLNLRPPQGPPAAPQVDPPEQTVNEGDPAQFRCWVPGNPQAMIRWSRRDGQPFPQGTLDRDGFLRINNARMSDAGDYICTASDPRGGSPQEAPPARLNVKPRTFFQVLLLNFHSTNSIRVLHLAAAAPQVDPPEQTVNEGDPAQFRCWVPGNPQAMIRWSRRDGQPLPQGAQDRDGHLRISSARMSDAGDYVCTASDPRGGSPQEAPPARLNVRPRTFPFKRSSIRSLYNITEFLAATPQVDPPEQTVNEGDPAQFRCWVPGNPHAVLRWSKHGGAPLPPGASERDGVLQISNAKQSDAGAYVCSATDPRGGPPADSPPARLHHNSLRLSRFTATPFTPRVEPPHQTVNEGEPAQFRCWVPGHPHATFRWSRQSGEPFHQDTLERDGFLRINRARMTDAGDYICTAYDPTRGGAPIQAPPARLHVKKPAAAPQVDPPAQTVDEGQPSSIRCWVPGNPNARLRWTKHGRQPLPSHAQERDGVLTIPQTMKADEGYYVCTAVDPQSGSTTDAPPAHIGVRQPSGLRPQVDPIEQSVPEGSPFRIRCWVPGNPNVHLSWRRANGDINDDSTQNQGILTVNRAALTDAGEYICSAEDPRTGEEAEAPPATVHVTPPERGPQISPPEQTVPEGDPASIRCWVEGDPQAQLSFKRADGAPIPFGATDQGGVLVISSTLKSDEGDYICTYHPKDRKPKDSMPSKLIVKAPGGPPRPVATPPVLTVKKGQPARFHCDAHSPTPAEIKWGHGDADSYLPEGVTHAVDDIIIDEADYSHEGEYVCSATNEFGTGVAEPVQLVVTDDEQPPTARVEPRVWNGKPGDRHQFKCITTGVPTPKVTWSGPNNSPLPHDVTALEDNILDFANGRTELNGDYTCTATNPVGEASDHGSVNIGPSLTVKTTPAGPRLILTVGEPLHQFIRHPAIGLGNAGAYTCKGSNSHATATKNIYIEVVEPSRVATVSILGGSSQWFEQGEPSELICTATGSSLVDRLEWVKVDDQLPTDVEEHNEPGLLHFPNFKNSYAGEYECRGYRNNELIASSSVHVHAATDDTDDARVEIEPPRVRVVSQGESIVLKCTVEGAFLLSLPLIHVHNPKTRVLWWRTDSLVDAEMIGSTPYLHLKYVDVCDRGIYYCTDEFTNYDYPHSVHTVVVLQQSPLVSRLELTTSNNKICLRFDGYHYTSVALVLHPIFASKILPSSTVVHFCPDSGAKNGEHFEWALLRGGNIVRKLGNEATLHIKGAEPSNDFGVYRCNVEDDNGLVIGSAYTAVSVGYASQNNAQVVKFDEKSDASFTCPIYSVPGSKVEWSRTDGDLPANAVPNGNKLDIKDFDDSAVGMYMCKVTFDDNVVEGYVDAQIFVPDTIIQVLLDVSSESVNVGDRAWFDCKVTGDPSAVIMWSKEGTDELPENSQVLF